MFLGLRLGAHFPSARIPYTDDLPLEDESDADDSEEADEALLPSAARQACSLCAYAPFELFRASIGAEDCCRSWIYDLAVHTHARCVCWPVCMASTLWPTLAV